MNRYRNFTAVLLCVALLIAAACSREGRQTAAVQTAAPEGMPAAAQNPDSCALVSKAEVQQVTGQDVGDPKPNPGNAAMCDYSFGDYGSVSFMVLPRGPGQTPGNMIGEFKKRNFLVTEASGIGDFAIFVSPGMGVTQLNAFKGQRYVILTLLIPGASEDKHKAAATELMHKALAKL